MLKISKWNSLQLKYCIDKYIVFWKSFHIENMEMRRTEVFWLVLKLFIFFQLFSICQFTLDGKEIEFNGGEDLDLKSRMLKIEEKSRLQDSQMEMLNRKAEKDRKMINQLEGRVLKLENPVDESEAQADKKFQRGKRIFRLLSPNHPNM